MTLTNTLVLKRYVRADGTASWVAYLPGGPVADVGLISVWAPTPMECLRLIAPAAPVLNSELVEPYRFSPS
jgi:hypothetical protein